MQKLYQLAPRPRVSFNLCNREQCAAYRRKQSVMIGWVVPPDWLICPLDWRDCLRVLSLDLGRVVDMHHCEDMTRTRG